MRRKGWRGRTFIKQTIQTKKSGISVKSYPRVHLIRNSKGRKWLVHRLVAKHFVKGYRSNKEVNHKDGNRNNNIFNNLEWVTRTENMRHAVNVLGIHRGENHARVKLTTKDILDIRKIYMSNPKYSPVALSKVYNVSYVHIIAIRDRKTWKHI